jgi:SAM-dependent methyltransferase
MMLYHAARALLLGRQPTMGRWRGLRHFVRNGRRYRELNREPSFELKREHLHYRSFDRFDSAGPLPTHYFHQDLWAARQVFGAGVRDHVDVGSRLDGFVAHVLPFCRVRYVDIRPLDADIPGFEFQQGSIIEMPFADGSVPSLSSLHVIEHIGLGRYGDPVQPDGYRAAARELTRVLAPGGLLLLGTPVGRERLCFDAHRVFDPQTIVDAFGGLRLDRFSLIDDRGNGVIENPRFEEARRCSYGCGLFLFRKDTEERDGN